MTGPLARNRKDAIGGAVMLLTGVCAAWIGHGYNYGVPSRIGPGVFPTALGVLLALVGAAMIAASASGPERAWQRTPPEWRAWNLIALGVVAFIVLGTYGGLVPASFAIVFLSALGDRGNTWRSAALLAAAMTVAVIVVFSYGLHLQFPLFSWG